jgi:hypothetical protein
MVCRVGPAGPPMRPAAMAASSANFSWVSAHGEQNRCTKQSPHGSSCAQQVP